MRNNVSRVQTFPSLGKKSQEETLFSRILSEGGGTSVHRLNNVKNKDNKKLKD